MVAFREGFAHPAHFVEEMKHSGKHWWLDLDPVIWRQIVTLNELLGSKHCAPSQSAQSDPCVVGTQMLRVGVVERTMRNAEAASDVPCIAARRKRALVC